MQILKGSTRHRSSKESTAWGSMSGTSCSAGASIGTPPRRATNSARWAPVRVSKIATTLDFMLMPFKHHNAGMSNWLRALIGAAMISMFTQPSGAQPTVPPVQNVARAEFMAAMLRVRLRQPDVPDSPALQHYAIYDYLVAARLRRDLSVSANENLD